MKINRAYCEIHDKNEWWFPWYYKACGECMHVWKTKEDFTIDVIIIDSKIYDTKIDKNNMADVDDETVCPLCYHDF